MTSAFAGLLIVVRGAGDLATGTAWRLRRCGAQVVLCELDRPLTVRRPVAFSTAITEGSTVVEGIRAVRAEVPQAAALARSDVVPVLVSASLPPLSADVVIDARLAKRVGDTKITDAPLVIALGPGFTAGLDCHAVVETMRGSALGRVFWAGPAAANSGTPGVIGGRGAERVLRAPLAGVVRWRARIGEIVAAGTVLGAVAGADVRAPFDGLIRGLIADGSKVRQGLKIGDVDPRTDTDWRQISDKALAVAGGVIEAILTWISTPDSVRPAAAPARSGSRPPAPGR